MTGQKDIDLMEDISGLPLTESEKKLKDLLIQKVNESNSPWELQEINESPEMTIYHLCEGKTPEHDKVYEIPRLRAAIKLILIADEFKQLEYLIEFSDLFQKEFWYKYDGERVLKAISLASTLEQLEKVEKFVEGGKLIQAFDEKKKALEC